MDKGGRRVPTKKEEGKGRLSVNKKKEQNRKKEIITEREREEDRKCEQ